MTSSAGPHEPSLDSSPPYTVPSTHPEPDPYLYTGSSSMLNRQSSTASTDDVVCEDCCCSLCTLLGCLVCCRRTSYKTRLRVVWAWLITVAIVAACIVHLHVFARQTFVTSPTDNRIVTKPGFGLFCQAGLFNSKQSFKVTSLPKPPSIDTSPAAVVHYTTTISLQLSKRIYVYRGFYLLKGTTVHVTPCSIHSRDIEQYFIKGRSNLDSMLDNNSCGRCTDNSVNTCWDKRMFKYTITETDEYYFLYDSLSVDSAKLDVKFELNRTNYDYSQTDEDFFCSSSEPCTVTAPMNPLQTLVYRGQENNGFQMTLTMDCDIRITLYLLLFGLAPFLIGLTVTCIIMCKANQGIGSTGSSGQSQNEEGQISSDRQRSQQPWLPPPYRDPPPKYEELVNEPETPPPPYPGTQSHI